MSEQLPGFYGEIAKESSLLSFEYCGPSFGNRIGILFELVLYTILINGIRPRKK